MIAKCHDWGHRHNQDCFHISMSNTYKVFDNLHMMWMCIWMCPNHITVALLDQESNKILGNSRQQLKAKCSHWGCIPNQDCVPINVKHIYKVFDKIDVIWMCILMCPNHITVALLDQAVGIGFWATLGNKLLQSAVIEAVDPIKIMWASMLNTYKVFDNLHMMWICIWIMFLNHIIAALIQKVFPIHLDSG